MNENFQRMDERFFITNCKITKLTNCKITKLANCKIAKLTNCKITGLVSLSLFSVYLNPFFKPAGCHP
jgi:hypothetical protein